jgi:hypothetical protein
VSSTSAEAVFRTASGRNRPPARMDGTVPRRPTYLVLSGGELSTCFYIHCL